MSTSVLQRTLWNTEEEEVFTFMFSRWDVRAAKRILASKNVKVDTVDVADCEKLLGGSRPNGKGGSTIRLGVSVDWEKVEIDLMAVEPKIDLSVPLIFVQTPEGNILPIDGYHRIAKAHKLGLTEIPAVLLSKKDSKAIQI
jgi:hypothetical protein